MSAAEPNNRSIRVVTPSYRGDLERCAALCASFDNFASPEFHHQVIVPRRDMARFRGLANARRDILCVEEVLPARALRLPGAKERWLLANRYREPGWLLQQIVKVAAARAGGVDAVVFADSDVAFVRPLHASHFLSDGRVRLLRDAGTDHYQIDPNYSKWNRGAGRLLGVTVDDPYPANFIGPLVSWVPSIAAAMCERMEILAGRPWIEAIGRLGNGAGFSEYTTYGVFVDRVDEAASVRHTEMPAALCHLSWNHDLGTPSGCDDFVRALKPENVAVVIQSNLRLPAADWRALLDRMATTARAGEIAGPTPSDAA